MLNFAHSNFTSTREPTFKRVPNLPCRLDRRKFDGTKFSTSQGNIGPPERKFPKLSYISRKSEFCHLRERNLAQVLNVFFNFLKFEWKIKNGSYSFRNFRTCRIFAKIPLKTEKVQIPLKFEKLKKQIYANFQLFEKILRN